MMIRTALLSLAAIMARVLVEAHAAEASCSTPTEEGHWKNDDPNTNSLTRADVRFVCQDHILNGEPYPPGPPWYLHVFGNCSPTDCDWGEVGAQRVEGGYVYGVYDHGFAKRFVWVRMSQNRPGHLWIYLWTDFVDPGRADYAIQAWFHRE
jgi:hypothetical protein